MLADRGQKAVPRLGHAVVGQQLVGGFEHEEVVALEALVAPGHGVDLVLGDAGAEGDADVLAVLVGGLPHLGHPEDGELAQAVGEGALEELVVVEAEEHLGQGRVVGEHAHHREVERVEPLARPRSGHLVAGQAEQDTEGGVLVVAPLLGGQGLEALAHVLRPPLTPMIWPVM